MTTTTVAKCRTCRGTGTIDNPLVQFQGGGFVHESHGIVEIIGIPPVGAIGRNDRPGTWVTIARDDNEFVVTSYRGWSITGTARFANLPVEIVRAAANAMVEL